MGVLLAISGFFRPGELKLLRALRRPGPPVTTQAETTELAGEIVAADIPDEIVGIADDAVQPKGSRS